MLKKLSNLIRWYEYFDIQMPYTLECYNYNSFIKLLNRYINIIEKYDIIEYPFEHLIQVLTYTCICLKLKQLIIRRKKWIIQKQKKN